MKDIRISLAAFYVITPIIAVLRVFQQFFMIDPDTGFYVAEYAPIASFISWTFLAVFALFLLLSVFSPKICLEAPKKSNTLGCAAFAVAAALFFDSAKSLILVSDNKLNLLIVIFAIASALCFVWYGLSLVCEIEFPKFMIIFPIFWALIDLISQFIRYTGQSSIIDYIISTVTMCLILFTLLSHSKIVTGITSRKETVIMVGFGLTTALFCIVDTLPTFIAILMGKSATLIHDRSVATPTIFMLAIYLPIFIHSMKKANLCEETQVADDSSDEAAEVADNSTDEVTEIADGIDEITENSD